MEEGRPTFICQPIPHLARLHLSSEKTENPLAPPPFCLLLRRYLEGSRILGIANPPGERIVQFTFSGLDELGNPSVRTLLVEIMGRHSNIILLSEKGLILDSIKRIGPNLSRHRQVLPGLPYLPPPSLGGRDPATARVADVRQVLTTAGPKKVWEALREGFRGLSPFLAKEVTFRGMRQFLLTKVAGSTEEDTGGDAGLSLPALATWPVAARVEGEHDSNGVVAPGRHGPLPHRNPATSKPTLSSVNPSDLTTDDLPAEAADYLHGALVQLFSVLENREFQPTLLLNPVGQPLDFAAVDPLSHSGDKIYYSAVNELLDVYYSQKTRRMTLEDRRSGLRSLLLSHLKKVERKVQLQEKDLQEAARGEEYRLFGELLKANLYRIEKGQQQARLNNYYELGSPEITIPLDPTRSPAENVQSYFRQYSKAKKTLEKTGQQLEESRAEAAYLQGVVSALEQSEGHQELDEIQQELVEQGYIARGKEAKNRRRKEPVSSSAPRRLISSDGFEILVGRNNRQNDVLTLKMADAEDIWLHTKDIPGSHVLIRVQKGPTPSLATTALGDPAIQRPSTPGRTAGS
ncbi:MAG: NFACT family protein, partial [Firmicutes bacterium]|nr:NFACT family protein [Bacillota bacterium]